MALTRWRVDIFTTQFSYYKINIYLRIGTTFQYITSLIIIMLLSRGHLKCFNICILHAFQKCYHIFSSIEPQNRRNKIKLIGLIISLFLAFLLSDDDSKHSKYKDGLYKITIQVFQLRFELFIFKFIFLIPGIISFNAHFFQKSSTTKVSFVCLKIYWMGSPKKLVVSR